MENINTTQKERAGFTSAIVKALEFNKKPSFTELKANSIINNLKDIGLTSNEMLSFLEVMKRRINLNIELEELEIKYAGNEKL